jgi:hypothetical protein
MKSLLKLSLAAITALLFTSCSGDKSSNTSSSASTTVSSVSNTGNFSMPDGYTLPPMPHEIISTLLGVDSNNNGVRDDVEHYIYNRFRGYTNAKVEREIAMQWARAAQQLIQNPETAYGDRKYLIMQNVVSCQWYYYNTYLENVKGFVNRQNYRSQHDIFDADFKDAVFNTKQRLKAYIRYGESMSGHVFDDYPETKDNCDFDVDALIEGRL